MKYGMCVLPHTHLLLPPSVHPFDVMIQATWKTPGFREYHRRMQLFILLYIEAGSYIQEEEESWEFVVL